jgi:hypothetical protein
MGDGPPRRSGRVSEVGGAVAVGGERSEDGEELDGPGQAGEDGVLEGPGGGVGGGVAEQVSGGLDEAADEVVVGDGLEPAGHVGGGYEAVGEHRDREAERDQVVGRAGVVDEQAEVDADPAEGVWGAALWTYVVGSDGADDERPRRAELADAVAGLIGVDDGTPLEDDRYRGADLHVAAAAAFDAADAAVAARQEPMASSLSEFPPEVGPWGGLKCMKPLTCPW